VSPRPIARLAPDRRAANDDDAWAALLSPPPPARPSMGRRLAEAALSLVLVVAVAGMFVAVLLDAVKP
jgi:hypothetical protein